MSSVTFQDAAGNPIANGIMVLTLNADAKSSVGQVYSKNITINLDSSGITDTSSIQLLSALTNNFASNNVSQYSITVYNANGEIVFGPSIPGNPILPSPLQ
jgi:hypothetical protein